VSQADPGEPEPETGPPRDAWARMTPYEVAIPGRAFADENFRRIAEEAEAREVDTTDPGAFILLGEVGRILKEIQGEEEGGEGEGGTGGGEALHRFGAFLFQAFHFHQAGELLLLAGVETVRGVVEERVELERWTGELPADAGYLQLPRHLVWSHPDPDGPAEDLDGVFWTRSVGDTLSLMAALGIRPDRPGLSVVPLPPVPLADAPHWPRTRVREDDQGPDFATTLPGGEMDELYSVVAMGELLKLVARIFAYMNAVPESLGALERSPHPDDVTDDVARIVPSLLPFRRIQAVEAASR